MEKQEIESWVNQGYLHTRVILEVIGKPQEYVQNSMDQYVEQIIKSENIKIISKEVAETKKQEVASGSKEGGTEEAWSTFAEIEFLIKGISKLVGFCFDYMPSSIEILAPERVVFTHHTITDFVNDLQAKLHKMDTVLKNQNNENQFLKKNMHFIIQNLVLTSLSGKKMDKEKLAKVTGIPEEGLKTFIEGLIKENRIKKEENLYSLT